MNAMCHPYASKTFPRFLHKHLCLIWPMLVVSLLTFRQCNSTAEYESDTKPVCSPEDRSNVTRLIDEISKLEVQVETIRSRCVQRREPSRRANVFEDHVGLFGVPTGNCILLIGGMKEQGVTNTLELYCPNNPRDNRIADAELITGRAFHAAGLLDDRIFVAGGFHESGFLGTTEVYHQKGIDHRAGQFLQSYPLNEKRSNAASLTVDGKMMVCGGKNGLLHSSSCETMDPVAQRWSWMKPMRMARVGASAVAVDGAIYVMGGQDATGNLDVVERYDMKSKSWWYMPPMPHKSTLHAAAVLDPNIYICGGWNGTEATNRCVSLNPMRARWTELPPMLEPRQDFALVPFRRRLYAIGGWNSRGLLKSVERFDLADNTWHRVNGLVEPRFSFAHVAL